MGAARRLELCGRVAQLNLFRPRVAENLHFANPNRCSCCPQSERNSWSQITPRLPTRIVSSTRTSPRCPGFTTLTIPRGAHTWTTNIQAYLRVDPRIGMPQHGIYLKHGTGLNSSQTA